MIPWTIQALPAWLGLKGPSAAILARTEAWTVFTASAAWEGLGSDGLMPVRLLSKGSVSAGAQGTSMGCRSLYPALHP